MRDLITVGLLAGIVYLCLALPLSVLIGEWLREDRRRLETMLRIVSIAAALPWVALGVVGLVSRRRGRRRRRLAALGIAYLPAHRHEAATELSGPMQDGGRRATYLLVYPSSHTQIVAHLRRVHREEDPDV